jgi:hypothetical protein
MEAHDATLSSPDATRKRSFGSQLVGFNMLWAIVGGIVGYAVGHWIGVRITTNIAAQVETDQNDVAIFLGMTLATVGWLAGLGFFSYPLSRMMGRPATLREREEHGPWRYFRLCTDCSSSSWPASTR